MTTLAKYIDSVARAPAVEGAVAPTAPKGRGSMPKKPRSTFNPLKADKALTTDDDAIVQAYRTAINTLRTNLDLGGKPFTLEDDQILVTVRSVPGPSTEEVEGKRLDALLKTTGVEHKAPDIAVTNLVAEHEAWAEKEAAHFPAAATETLRKTTASAEFTKIAALVLRQNFLDDANYGKAWLRNFDRIGYRADKEGDDGRKFNSAEYYPAKYNDAKGVERTKYVSAVADFINKSPDGKVQHNQIALIDAANKGDEKSPYYTMGKKVRADEMAKWKSRNALSIQAMRQAIHIEQIIQDLETAAPNVIVQIKYKRDNEGNDTKELRNSQRPITVHDSHNIDSMEEFSIRDFTRLKPFKAVVSEKQKDKGANVVQLKTTAARKTQAARGQGKVETTVGEDIASGKKVLVSAKQALQLITVTLANYFDVGVTQPDRQDYLKRTADLQSLMTNKNADEEVLAFGYVLSEMQDIFQPLSLRYSNMKRDKAEAEGEEKKVA